MGIPRRGYPGRVTIRDETWRVRFVKKITVFPKDPHVVGYCDEDRKVIVIKKQEPIEELKTFIHELLHAICAEYGTKLKHKQIYELEEALGDFIAENFK